MRAAPFFALALIAPEAAFAHGGHAAGGFSSGFLHPMLGWDHVAAMVAVGLWGATLGGQARLVLPLVFPLVMALGAAMAGFGLALPMVEAGIAASAVALGLLVMSAARLPLAAAAALVAVFAVFHGHAHGAELPATADPLAYGVGFVAATALLHAAGLGFGLVARAPAGRIAVRVAGGAISLAGLAFLAGAA